MSRARDHIGADFDHVYASTSVTPDNAFLNNPGTAGSNVQTELTPENAAHQPAGHQRAR